jgi:hypothetical protein
MKSHLTLFKLLNYVSMVRIISVRIRGSYLTNATSADSRQSLEAVSFIATFEADSWHPSHPLLSSQEWSPDQSD